MNGRIGEQVCKVCGESALDELPKFRALGRVTSDCRPFGDGGRLLMCGRCGAAQSPSDEQWLNEINEIYSAYYAYHQAGGLEQYVSDPATGKLAPRSEVFVGRLLAMGGFPECAEVLDVGCGTGGTLRAFAERTGWRLSGLELDERNLHFLTSIKNFEKLYTCPPDNLPRQFDLITLVHTLEHFADPRVVLESLGGRIAPGGRIFIEVPNVAANPFDYVIADHMLHFTAPTLSLLLERAGFEVECMATDWVSKELSAVARPMAGRTDGCVTTPRRDDSADAGRRVEWLTRFLEDARDAASEGRPFGLFGSSIAATWLYSSLQDRVSFFVDEDPNRIGRSHMDRPILSTGDVPHGSIVFLAMAPEAGRRIAERLQNLPFDLRVAPALARA